MCSNAVTRSLATEYAQRGVRVNAVAPGYIQTDMTSGLPAEIKEASLKRIPLGRLGEGADIARAVRFLVSEQAAYVTGIALAEEAALARPDLRVLYTSGYTDHAVTQHNRLAPDAHFLSKPYRTRDLAARIRQALDQKLASIPATAARAR